MSAPLILAARRADDLAAPRYAGEVPGTCEGCGAALAVGPRIQAARRTVGTHRLLCHACVTQLPGSVLRDLGNTALPPEVN